jgi:putative membrane protein
MERTMPSIWRTTFADAILETRHYSRNVGKTTRKAARAASERQIATMQNITVATGVSVGPSATSSGSTVLTGERRPTGALLGYYVLLSIVTGPAVIVILPWRYFRFRTLRYTFDAEGVSMRWGLLFRREVSLTYARIQDIHLVSNIVERWLGLGRVQIQTASGQAGAELTIEGLPDFETVRDELYRRMRGARVDHRPDAAAPPSHSGPALEAGADTTASSLADAVVALNAAVAELRALRQEITNDAREVAAPPVHAEGGR